MKKKRNKKRSNAWFIKVRGSYLPNNTIGWLSYIPFLAYLVVVAVLAAYETDSIVVAILFIVPNWAVATAAMTYIASRHS